MASIVAEHLRCTTQRELGVGVVYWFCNYREQEKQDDVHLPNVVLKQLIHKRPSLLSSVEGFYSSAELNKRPPSVEVQGILRFVLRDFTRLYIVMYGLDEYTDDKLNKMMSEVRGLRGLKLMQVRTEIKVMVTSRPLEGIRRLFKDDLRLEVRANNEDVERYVEGRMLQWSPEVLQDHSHLGQQIKSSIIQAVDGM